jgi:hypothetical protein
VASPEGLTGLDFVLADSALQAAGSPVAMQDKGSGGCASDGVDGTDGRAHHRIGGEQALVLLLLIVGGLAE